jgi:hypothetical protein
MGSRLRLRAGGVGLAGRVAVGWLLFAAVGCQSGNGQAAPAAGPKPVFPHVDREAAGTRHVELARRPPYFAQSKEGACWIACTRMVYAYHGRQFTEEQVNARVTEVTGNDRGEDLHASRRECMIALANDLPGGWVEALRHRLKEGSVSVKLNPILAAQKLLQSSEPPRVADLVRAIEAQQPVVLVYRMGGWTDAEHAVVVTGVTYAGTGAEAAIASVDVLDPANGGEVPTTLEGETVATQIRAMYTKESAEKLLREEMQAVQVGPYQAAPNGGSGAGKSHTKSFRFGS